MSPIRQRILDRESALPELPAVQKQESKLNIAVVFTSASATIAALKTAGKLAESLGAKITLLSPQIVPYPLPLASPPVPLEFQEQRLREIAAQAAVQVQVGIYLCRDALPTLKTLLSPHSLVVLGGRRQWWPTREQNLARKLRRAGHDVILTEG